MVIEEDQLVALMAAILFPCSNVVSSVSAGIDASASYDLAVRRARELLNRTNAPAAKEA